MTSNFTNAKKTTKKQYVDTNPVESFRDVGKGVGRSFSQDFLKGTTSSMWDQFLGVGEYKPQPNKSGDLTPGEELDFSQIKKENQKFVNVKPGLDYRREIIHTERRVLTENSQVIKVQIEQILTEIKKLISASSEIEIQYRTMAVAEAPVNPGKYHATFFEWVLNVVRSARVKVEDSANWLSMFASKKNKRQYWNMFKKHGTTFGLSNERVVSTQTG